VNLVIDSVETQPIAKICGELMEIRRICISCRMRSKFSGYLQGPLDLLLYLIRKHNLEILDNDGRAHQAIHGLRHDAR
jgi:hypothetical protein